MKRFIFIISIIVFLPTNGFLPLFLRRLTPVNIIQGGINNGILGALYYLGFYKKKQRELEDMQEFAKNAQLLQDKPEFLKNFEVYTFKKGPQKKLILSHFDKDKNFYVFDQKVYVSEEFWRQFSFKRVIAQSKNAYDVDTNMLTIDRDLLFHLELELQRQSTLPAIQSESTEPFLWGIAKVIFGKKVVSKVLYPTFRPWLNQKGFYFSSWSWSYPKVALSSIADLCTKFFYGILSFTTNRHNKYIQSCNEVIAHTIEQEIEKNLQKIKELQARIEEVKDKKD